VVLSGTALAVPARDAEDADELPATAGSAIYRTGCGGEPHFAPTDQCSDDCAICRRLDGIPLAMRAGSARAAVLRVRRSPRTSRSLPDFDRGRRTALPRHQTLRATLDWSYELLERAERVILRRLAVFAGGFSG